MKYIRHFDTPKTNLFLPKKISITSFSAFIVELFDVSIYEDTFLIRARYFEEKAAECNMSSY